MKTARIGALRKGADEAVLVVGVQHAGQEIAKRLAPAQRSELDPLGCRREYRRHEAHRGHFFPREQDERQA